MPFYKGKYYDDSEGDYDYMGNWRPTTRADRVFTAIFIVILLSPVAWLFVWMIWISTGTREVWTDCQKVIEVQAVGHKYSTSYYIRGENGGVMEGQNIVQVGEMACFSSHTETNRMPFIEWILQPVKEQ